MSFTSIQGSIYALSRQLENFTYLLIHMLAEGNKHTITAMLTQPTQLVEGPWGTEMELDYLEPLSNGNLDHLGRFAMLIPMNAVARSAIQATARSGSPYHQQFIDETIVGDRVTKCFTLSLGNLPQFAQIGWRIGRGRDSLNNSGVDLLLTIEDRCIDEDSGESRIAGIHARFNWIKGAGGFFLIADNKKGEPVMMDGEIYRHDQRSIQLKNSIMIGECVFTLRYFSRTPEEEEQFQVELAEFFRVFHDEMNPLVLPLPSDNEMRYEDWIFQRPISRGAYGVVYMVVNARTGVPAAAKRILKSPRNAYAVDREIKMATRISKLSHVSGTTHSPILCLTCLSLIMNSSVGLQVHSRSATDKHEHRLSWYESLSFNDSSIVSS